jgi:hypothetical protein
MDNANIANCCPVCGFDLGFRPWDGASPSNEICLSCGIPFAIPIVPEVT